MPKVLAVIQARMGSSRLPGKVMQPILGEPMLARQIERLRRARTLDHIVVATSDQRADDDIAAYCASAGVQCFRGSLDDVLDRFYGAASPLNPRHVVRLTADCPLADAEVIDAVVDLHLAGGYDYSSNTVEPTFPDGLDVEVMTMAALEAAWREAVLPSEREHVTPFIHRRPERFHLGALRYGEDLSRVRLTVDEPEDLELVRRVYAALYAHKPDFAMADIVALLERDPALNALNGHYERNEGAKKSLSADAAFRAAKSSPNRYARSQELFQRAVKTVPLASQTFSKSHLAYPQGQAPLFLSHGKGSHVWDVDGNEYIDFVNGLLPVVLGYDDPDVTVAAIDQVRRGVSLSLATDFEMRLAEKLVELVPCAEMARFGKNGSDATSGAIRVARAFTGRDRVAVCGYHGWQDWYIGTTARRKGVPKAVQELTHPFAYNDLAALDAVLSAHSGEFACVIMEAMTAIEPQPGYLAGVRDLAHRHGALFILDEIITGFRFALGGAQELFGVTPDLATLGKSMGNGFPISAVVGRRDIMREMEDVFFSFTAGGEAVSLVAALATIEKMQREDVIGHLWRQGDKIAAYLGRRLPELGLSEVLTPAGKPCWLMLGFKDGLGVTSWQVKTLFLQEMLAHGILINGAHNMSFAHSDADIAALLAVYDQVLPILAEAVRGGAIDRLLKCPPMEPVFKVR